MKGIRKLFAIMSAAAVLSCPCATLAQASAATYSFVNTNSDYGSLKLKAAPAVIADICDSRNVQYVSETSSKATNALVRVDGNGNVLDVRGNVIEPLNDFLGELSKKVIPNFLVESDGGLQSIVSYASSQQRFGDAAVISAETEILKAARTKLPYLRRIYDVSGSDGFDGGKVAKEANESGAVAIILNAAHATKENVEYLQQRAKSVWARLDGKDEFSVFKGIASGALGLITEGDPQVVSSVYNVFEGEMKSTLSRSPLNVAHRGLPYSHNENSLEGFEAAIAAGATHLEVDAQMTKDGKIVIMHDNDLKRTTNIDPSTVSTTAISSMTLEEVRRYRIVKTYAGVTTGTESVIPTIDELFDLCKEKDILFFFEIKTSNARFAGEFKSKIEEYGMQEKIVVISFEDGAMSDIRTQIPYLWALDLKDRKISVAETVTGYCEKDTGCDMSSGNLSVMRDLLERGFMPSAWTYESKSSFKTAALDGVYAITNNEAAECAVYPKTATIGNLAAVKKEDLQTEGFTVTAQVTAYNGQTKESTGKLLSYRDMGEYAEAVFLINAGDWNMMSDVVRIDYVAEQKGCGAGISSIPFALIGSIAMTGAILFGKSRKKFYNKRGKS